MARLFDLPQYIPQIHWPHCEVQLEHLRGRPSLEEIARVVAKHFGVDTTRWSPDRRSNDASRAVAAYMARRRFGYPTGEVDKAVRIPDGGFSPAALAVILGDTVPGDAMEPRGTVKSQLTGNRLANTSRITG